MLRSVRLVIQIPNVVSQVLGRWPARSPKFQRADGGVVRFSGPRNHPVRFVVEPGIGGLRAGSGGERPRRVAREPCGSVHRRRRSGDKRRGLQWSHLESPCPPRTATTRPFTTWVKARRPSHTARSAAKGDARDRRCEPYGRLMEGQIYPRPRRRYGRSFVAHQSVSRSLPV